MGIQMNWNDSRRVLTLRLAEGSRMLPPAPRHLKVRLAAGTPRRATFTGQPAEFRF
jgi:hypothetical protein